MPDSTPARILQHLLEKKWALQPGDQDMIVMLHDFVYTQEGKEKHLHSVLVVKGDDQVITAMAKTVGLPLGMVARRMVKGEINLTGVHIPVMREVYEPVLKELESMNISFIESLRSFPASVGQGHIVFFP